MSGLSSSRSTQILRSGVYSDFKITCQGVQFNVHRVILGTASTFFEAIFKNDCKERHNALVDLPDDHPAIVARMLEYVYDGIYSETITTDLPQVTEESPVVAYGSSIASELPHESMSVERAKSTIAQTIETVQNDTSGSVAEDNDHGTLQDETLNKTISRLRLHVLVYQIADKLGIQGLCAYAYYCFRCEWTGKLMSHVQFADLAELVYSSTPATDSKIRSDLTRVIVKSHGTAYDNAKIADVIMKHEPMAWVVGAELVTECQTELKTMGNDHAKLKLQLDEDLKAVKKERDSLKAEVQNLKRARENTDSSEDDWPLAERTVASRRNPSKAPPIRW